MFIDGSQRKATTTYTIVHTGNRWMCFVFVKNFSCRSEFRYYSGRIVRYWVRKTCRIHHAPRKGHSRIGTWMESELRSERDLILCIYKHGRHSLTKSESIVSIWNWINSLIRGKGPRVGPIVSSWPAIDLDRNLNPTRTLTPTLTFEALNFFELRTA